MIYENCIQCGAKVSRGKPSHGNYVCYRCLEKKFPSMNSLNVPHVDVPVTEQQVQTAVSDLEETVRLLST